MVHEICLHEMAISSPLSPTLLCASHDFYSLKYFCYLDHRENILKTAKALVEDTKTLVAGAASSQEQLAVAAQNAVTTIVQLSDVVKNGAASLGSQNQEAQVKNQTFNIFLL
jgi:hypothetical protein